MSRRVSEPAVSLWLDGATDATIADRDAMSGILSGSLTGVGPELSAEPRISVQALRALGDDEVRARRALALAATLRLAGRLAGRLRAAHEASGGCDGLVQVQVPAHVAKSPPDAIALGLRIRQATGAANVAVGLPFDAAALTAAEELVARGVSVAIGPIFTAEEYATAARRYLEGLERRHDDGQSLANIAALTWTPIGVLDAYFGSSAHAGTMPGLAPGMGGALGQLVYSERFRSFSGRAWRRLQHAGAWPMRAGFCALDRPLLEDHLRRLALPGAVIAVDAETSARLDPSALGGVDPDETEARWTVREIERHGLELRAISRALRSRVASRWPFGWGLASSLVAGGAL